MSWRRALLILPIAAAVAGGALYYAAHSRPRTLVLTGIVTTDDVLVSSEIQGRLARLLVREGDTVKPDQLLAVIAPQELEADRSYYLQGERTAAAQVQEAEAALRYQELQTRDQVRQAQEGLAAAQAQEAEAAANTERARLDAMRMEDLYRQGMIAAQVNDQARTTYQAAVAHQNALQRQVEAQKAALALARSNEEQNAVRRSQLQANRHQVAAAAAQREKAQVRLGYTEIRSPIGGTVTVRAARQGEVVNPGQPIVSLINPDDLWVRADVEETYIDRIRLGDRLTVRLPSGVERTGTVFYRAVDADFATQRDVSRTKRDIKTFEVRLRLDNSDRRLATGMTAYVILPIS